MMKRAGFLFIKKKTDAKLLPFQGSLMAVYVNYVIKY